VVAERDDHRGPSVTLGEPIDEVTEFADASDNEFAEGLDERLDALGYR
jgi:hypothetical protein